ncbi:hypothetical protein [Geobacter sulfurreducens]|uniref:hypothetical protein n=1 Tax=Geobacter sulfurreducens TaxID=35554 RepID=UPI002D07D2E7|nr:hypothetical protein [Geobacter sulfurreducens]HML79034.1 hypothetical protein [Geobacter sulfurreducens]
MDASNAPGTVVKRRRLTMAEFAAILDSVAEKLKSKTVRPLAPLPELRAPEEIYQEKPKKYFSKAAAFGASEKILALVALNPERGTQRLKKSLAEQGISLSRQSIHKILLKHNLNRPAMRKTWQARQKETNP